MHATYQRAKAQRSAAREERVHPQHADPALIRLFGGNGTAAGEQVTERTATQIPTVYACVTAISETQATLPAEMFEHGDNGDKTERPDLPLARLFTDMANDHMDAVEFRQMMTKNALLSGNAIAVKVMRRGVVEQLLPVPVGCAKCERRNGQVIYEISWPGGRTDTYLADEIFHLRWTTTNGLWGMSVIEECRESFGTAQALEKYAGSFFGNQAQPTGILTKTPGFRNADDRKDFESQWNERHKGAGNAGRVAILGHEIKWQSIGVSNEDAQFLDSRRFTVEEICRIFRVPPPIIQDHSHSTFSNVEHLSLDFAKYTILPWNVRWEQAIRRCLMTQAERDKYFIEFNMDAVLRGDFKTRMDGWSVAAQNGILDRNEIRSIERFNRRKGLDQITVQSNMATLTEQGIQMPSAQPANQQSNQEPTNAPATI